MKFATFTQEIQIDSTEDSFLNTQYAKISKKSWQKSVQYLCPFIQEWQLLNLQAFENKYPSILKDIENIKFLHLRRVVLFGNNIETIEGLSKLQIPEIRQFYISNNRHIKDYNDLSCISEMKKLNWVNLSILSINGNRINEASPLTLLPLKKVQILFLEYLKNKEKQQYYDIRQICKLKMKVTSAICSKQMIKI